MRLGIPVGEFIGLKKNSLYKEEEVKIKKRLQNKGYPQQSTEWASEICNNKERKDLLHNQSKEEKSKEKR